MNAEWRVLSGAAAGMSHLRQGHACEDAFATCRHRGTLLVAVCDGCSSAPLSGVGAPLAAILALDAAKDCFDAWGGPPADGPRWHALLEVVLRSVVKRYMQAARAVAGLADGHDAGDLGTTLTFVAVSPPWIAVLAIGDGFVVTRSADGTFDLLLPPDPDGPDAGVTTFLTSTTAMEAARHFVACIEDVTGVAVSTDGLADVALQFDASMPRRPIAGFFGPVFGWADDPGIDDMRLSQLLVSKRVCDVADDDKTLIVAVPR